MSEDWRLIMPSLTSDQILKNIQERKSTRISFDLKRPVSSQDLQQVLEAGRWAPTAHNMQNFEIIVVDDRELLESIGNIEHPISKTFIRENYQQLSFSEEELLQKKVGILGTMFPPAWRTPEGIDEIDETSDKKDNRSSFMRRLVQDTPVLLIVVYDPSRRAPASEGDFLGIISLGCVMENMWLMAQSLGLGFHIVSALSADIVESEIKNLLNIPEDLKIAFACRLGYPATKSGKYLRVRRDVKDYTYHNQFGNKNFE